MNFGLSKSNLDSIVRTIKSNLGQTEKPKIYIYGSRVKGNAREFSDIDLLLVAESYDEKSLGLIDFEEMDIPYKVDFVLDKNLFEDYSDEIHGHMIELARFGFESDKL